MKKKKDSKLKLIIILIIIFLMMSNIGKNQTKQIKIGIIDTSLSKYYMEEYSVLLMKEEITCADTSHGDMVLDIISKQAPKSKNEVYIANVLKDDLTGSISAVIEGIKWLNEMDVNIICMAFTTLEDNPLLKEAIQDSILKGRIIVASCINYSDYITYPANYDDVISVSNVSNSNATLSYKDGNAKSILKKYNWKDTSSSALTAYTTGKIVDGISHGKKIEKIIEKLKGDKK